MDSLAEIAGRIQKELAPDDLVKLSSVVLVYQDNPDLEAINAAIKVEHGSAEIRDQDFFGLLIRYAYIITSQRREAETAGAFSK